MAPKPLPSDDEKTPLPADGPLAPEPEKRLAPTPGGAGDKPAALAAPDDDDEDDDEEDLVVFTAKEAAGALATIWAFVKPLLANYKKTLTFVAIGIVVETLFNVIMPLSLKFLIDDALGEEDFEALYK